MHIKPCRLLWPHTSFRILGLPMSAHSPSSNGMHWNVSFCPFSFVQLIQGPTQNNTELLYILSAYNQIVGLFVKASKWIDVRKRGTQIWLFHNGSCWIFQHFTLDTSPDIIFNTFYHLSHEISRAVCASSWVSKEVLHLKMIRHIWHSHRVTLASDSFCLLE